MNQQSLLREVENLPHDARLKRMVAVGQSAATDKSAAATLAQLAQGDFYERYLALQACYGSRDADLVLRSLNDESRILRGIAVGLVQLVCNTAQAITALQTVPNYLLRNLLYHLFKADNLVIDSFFAQIDPLDQAKRILVLPFCATEVIRQNAQLLPFFDDVAWNTLARLHPALSVELLQQQTAALAELPAPWIARVNSLLAILSAKDPDVALALAAAFVTKMGISALQLQTLLQRRPEQVAQLTLANAQDSTQSPVSFTTVAHRVQSQTLIELYRLYPSDLGWVAGWFPRLAHPARQAVYAELRLAWYDQDGTLASRIIDELPGAARESEARRNMALPVMQTRTPALLSYAAFLPWDEALAFLTPYIQNPDADLRGQALAALIAAARYDRSRLPDLLRVILARRNEQDPVRLLMLNGIAALPPARWGVDLLDQLGQVFRHALDARDLSPDSIYSIERMLVAIAPFHPEWAGNWLAIMLREHRQVMSNLKIVDRWSLDVVHRIAPLLLPTLQTWLTHGYENELTNTERAFGKRLPLFPEFINILSQLLAATRNRYVASSLITLLSEHSPATFAELAPKLLRADESWMLIDAFREYLNRHRQDLLTRFLSYRAYKGRFHNSNKRELLTFSHQFYRWTAKQQTIYADAIAEMARLVSPDVPLAKYDVNTSAALPAVAPTRLIEIANSNSVPQVERDLALLALGRLDSLQGVPTLLAALGDDRGRIAIYALQRPLREMPAPNALALLRQTPMDKVTVAKQVVRMIGVLKTDEALQYLLGLDATDLHRDVRAALIGAIANYPEHEQSWDILHRAAVSPDKALAAAVSKTRISGLTPENEQRLVSLLDTLLQHPDPQVRQAVLLDCLALPVADPAGVLLRRLLTFLTSPLPDERSNGASAAFANAWEKDAALISTTISALLPNRPALANAVDALSGYITNNKRKQPLKVAAINAMAPDPLTASLRAKVAVSALDPAELSQFLADLAARGELHADALFTTLNELPSSGNYTEPDFTALEQLLAVAPDERLRRVALLALTQAAEQGWTPERRERLKAYQSDPSILVAGAAQFIFPPEE